LLDEVEKVCSHVLILRKGEVLYSGRVDEMTSNEGFFELQSDDNHQLMTALSAIESIQKLAEENGKVYAYLKKPLESKELNQLLFEKGIILSHLVKRKHSLEDQFLELTNQPKSKK
jgi:ABC-2 type transport system ATP-binding protein